MNSCNIVTVYDNYDGKKRACDKDALLIDYCIIALLSFVDVIEMLRSLHAIM